MAYQAQVYSVMIASPSDVREERRLIQEAIVAWNFTHSLREKIVLLPLMWETHSAPLLGDRPQAIINQQVLKQADLLVGIFGSRIGTPTGREISGTVEEIAEHIALFKPALVYFSEHHANTDGLDATQLEEVNNYEVKCRSKGLTGKFTSPENLRDQFVQHLQITINTHKIFQKPDKGSPRMVEDTVGILEGRFPELIDQEKALLIEVSRDSQNRVSKIPFRDKIVLETNNRKFEEAVWLAALDQLCNYEYLRVKSEGSGEFVLTDLGNQALVALAKDMGVL
jgi:hypothetical protein